MCHPCQALEYDFASSLSVSSVLWQNLCKINNISILISLQKLICLWYFCNWGSVQFPLMIRGLLEFIFIRSILEHYVFIRICLLFTDCLFSPVNAFDTWSKIRCLQLCVFISGSSSLFHWSTGLLCHTLCVTMALWYSLNLCNMALPAVFFLLRTALAICGLLLLFFIWILGLIFFLVLWRMPVEFSWGFYWVWRLLSVV